MSNAVLSSHSSPVTFTSLNLAPPILEALRTEGYSHPTPIQAQAIPHALLGRDLLGIAQTGTGKTAAFALPIIHRLMADAAQPANPHPHGPRGHAQPQAHASARGRAPRVLVLAPTRELAAQIGESFNVYGRNTRIRAAVIFGGVGQHGQVEALRRGVDVVVATPGRLLDLMEQRLVDLRSVSFAVLDEADRMLDMGFIVPIRRIMSALPKTRQTMLFSATMPTEIRGLADSFLSNPVRVAVTPVASTVERVEQCIYGVDRELKIRLLLHVLGQPGVDRTLVFTKTKHGADKVVKRLHAAGISATAIHGNKAQNHRIRALAAFKSGDSPVLVATDIAARGIDVDSITHVINFDMPVEPESYVHRIGRTARAGASGIAISFCSKEERPLLRAIEKLTRANFTSLPVPATLPKAPEPPPSSHASHDRGGPRHSTGPRQHQAHGRPKSHGARSAGSGQSSRSQSQGTPKAAPSQPAQSPQAARVAAFANRSGRGGRRR